MILLLSTLYVSIFGTHSSITAPSDNGVYELDAVTFDQFIDGNEFVFVKFLNGDSPYEYKLMVYFEELAFHFKNKIVFAQINVIKHPNVAQNNGIDNFPTLRLYVRGQNNYVDYFGVLDKKMEIKYFLEAILTKDFHSFSSDYLAEEQKSLIFYGYGIYCGSRDSDNFSMLKKAYQLSNNIVIYMADNARVCDDLFVEGNQLRYIRKSAETELFIDFENEFALNRFFKFARFDLINKFTDDLVGEAVSYNIPMLVYIDSSKSGVHIELFKETGIVIKDNYTLFWNMNKSAFEKQYISMIGHKRDSPGLYIVSLSKQMTITEFKNDWTKVNLINFLREYLAIHYKNKPFIRKSIEEAAKAVAFYDMEDLVDLFEDSAKPVFILNCKMKHKNHYDILTAFALLAKKYYRKSGVRFGIVDVDEQSSSDSTNHYITFQHGNVQEYYLIDVPNVRIKEIEDFIRSKLESQETAEEL